MQRSSNYEDSRFNVPEWTFLGEFSFGELLFDKDRRNNLTARRLFQATRDLEIAAERLGDIERTLMDFVRQAGDHTHQGRLELPVLIRLYYKKRTNLEANSEKYPSRFTGQQTS